MNNEKRAFKTLSWLLSILLLAGGIAALSFYYFGAPGASGEDLESYATEAIVGAMGTPVLLDAGSASKVAFAGLENGGIGGASFLKVPFVDRYVVSQVAYQGPSSFRKLVLRVDNGADRFFVSYDGATLNQGKTIPWAGSYTHYVLWLAMIVLTWSALMVLGLLLRRRT